MAIPIGRFPNNERVDPTVVESSNVSRIVVPRRGRKLVGRSGHAPPDQLEVFAVLPPLFFLTLNILLRADSADVHA